MFKTQRIDKLKKIDIMENNQTRTVHTASFQYADTSKNLSQRFKVQEFHTNRNLTSAEIHL